jgi:hypothetical protein
MRSTPAKLKGRSNHGPRSPGAGALLEPAQMLGLNFEQTGFQGGAAAQPPQGTGQPQHQFPLHGGLRVIVGDNGGFEGLLIGGIFQRADHRRGGESLSGLCNGGTRPCIQPR